MRIVIPIHSYEPGGVERVALNLAQAWEEAGDRVTVVLGRRDGAMAAIAPELNCVVRQSRVPTASFETLWMIWCLWRYLKREPADVLFCPGNTYAIVAAAMKLLLGRRCPPIAIKLSNDLARRDLPAPARLVYQGWLRLQGRLFDRFVGMAEPMRREIVDAMRVEEDHVRIIEDPSLASGQITRLAAIRREPAPGAVPHFLAIGRLAPQKNFALLVRAFARGAPSASTLTILGEGPERRSLQRLAQSLGVADRIAMPGHCDDTLPWLRDATALVMSSDYEGVPAVVLEALAAGLPVITTDCSVSMAGLLGHGQLGALVPVGDEARLAAALAACADLPFAPADARTAAQDFTIARAAPRYRALFLELVSAKPAPAAVADMAKR